MRTIAATLIALLLFSTAVRADDFGPPKDIRDINSAAKRLLANRVRPLNASAIAISDTVVVKDQALLTWRAGSQVALMGLVRYADRWWDALDEVDTDNRTFDPLRPACVLVTAAFPMQPRDVRGDLTPVDPTSVGMTHALMDTARHHNAFANTIAPVPPLSRAGSNLLEAGCVADSFSFNDVPQDFSTAGGVARQPRDVTAGYDVSLRYAANDAAANAHLTSLRARAPSPSEFLSLNAPFAEGGYGTGVVFLYVDTDSKKPIAFQKGGSFDIWVPWVLNDSLRYELEFYTGKTQVGPIKATVFDNVLHFDLPAFSLPPGETLGEVDGYY